MNALIQLMKKWIKPNPKTQPSKDSKLIKWLQPPTTHTQPRYVTSFGESYGIKLLRDNETRDPAPFSFRTLIETNNNGTGNYESPVDISTYLESGKVITKKMDIPINKIIGAHTTNNLDNYTPGLHYRDILFQCLHGIGITQDSLDFLSGYDDKDKEMPHEPVREVPKSFSKRELEFVKYGDWFVSSNGHQRAIMAMFYLWQTDGDKGSIKNVTVHEWLIQDQ